MDGVLSAITIIQTTTTAVKTLVEFTQTIRKAPDEITSLENEANSLLNMLRNFNNAVADPEIRAYVARDPRRRDELNSLKQPLELCVEQIIELKRKIRDNTEPEMDGKRKFKRFRWYIVKDDVIETRNELSRITQNANLGFSGGNYFETLRRNAQLDVSRDGAFPSPLKIKLDELQKQGELLRKAAKDGDARAVKLLLDAQVPVDSKNEDGRTPLSLAAEHGNLEAIKMLIAKGALMNSADEDQRMPLHWAALRGHNPAIGFLLEAGADIDKLTQAGRSAAVEAARARHVKTVDYLLDRGANINSRTSNGWTMLHWAVHNGEVEFTDHILSRGADVEAVYTGTWHGEGKGLNGGKNQRPLHYAVIGKRPNPDEVGMVRLLLKKGRAKLSAQDSNGATSIHYAIQLEWKAALQVLLRYATAADLKIKDSNGRNAFSIASKTANQEIISIIKARQGSNSGK